MRKWEQPQAFFNSSVDASGLIQAPAAFLNTEELPVHRWYQVGPKNGTDISEN